MKALLYKDFLVLTKQMKAFLVMVCLFCVIPTDFSSFSYFFVAYAGLAIPSTLLAYDERAGWDRLAAMLPYTTRELVLSRYVMGWLALAVAVVSRCIGLVLAPDLTFGLSENLGILLYVVSLTLLMMALELPILFRLGTEKARLYLIFSIAAISALVFGPLAALGSTWTPLFWFSALFVLAVAATVVSVRVSMKQYEQRQW